MLDVPENIIKPEVISEWIQCFQAVIGLDLGSQEENNCHGYNEEQRAKHFWWKAKKVCANNLQRLFQRYGNPQFPHASCKDFAKWFIDNYAVGVTNTVLQQLIKTRSK